MNRKTILTLSAVAAVAAIGVASIPAIAQNGPWGMGYGGMGHGGMGSGGMGHMMGQMESHGPMGMGGFSENPVFQSFDADKDGKVTAAEAEAGVTALLTKHDADKTGTLSEAEFGALFAEVTQSMAARPFAMLDDNGDKEISAEELTFPVKMMARMGRLTDVNANQPAQP
ncbi:MAG: EF-hand domain-containing protein [Paracoccaceae bacterium]